MLKFYLAGAIEMLDDHGVSTRDVIIKELSDIKEVELINPCDFEFNQENYPSMTSFRDDPDNSLLEVMEYSNNISSSDIKEVVKCDGVIAILDRFCGPGTGSETTLACQLGRPVLAIPSIHCKDWREIHPWTLGQITFWCENVDELKAQIMKWLKAIKSTIRS